LGGPQESSFFKFFISFPRGDFKLFNPNLGGLNSKPLQILAPNNLEKRIGGPLQEKQNAFFFKEGFFKLKVKKEIVFINIPPDQNNCPSKFSGGRILRKKHPPKMQKKFFLKNF
jgi:hypothetical protein